LLGITSFQLNGRRQPDCPPNWSKAAAWDFEAFWPPRPVIRVYDEADNVIET